MKSFGGVKFRTVFIIFIVSVIIPGIIYSLSTLPQKKIDTLYEQKTNETKCYIQNIIDLKSQMAEVLAYDYSYWDEMVNFVKTPNDSWAQENLDPALSSYGVDAIWVYDQDLQLKYGINVYDGDIKHNVGIDLPAATLSKVAKGVNFVHFYMKSGADVIEIYGASIHPSSDVERKTEASGYFFNGKYLGKSYLSTLSTSVTGQASLADSATPPDKKNTGELVTYIPLTDWFGENISNIKVVTEFTTLKSYSDEVQKSFLVNIIMGLFLSSAICWLVFIYSEGQVNKRRKRDSLVTPASSIKPE